MVFNGEDGRGLTGLLLEFRLGMDRRTPSKFSLDRLGVRESVSRFAYLHPLHRTARSTSNTCCNLPNGCVEACRRDRPAVQEIQKTVKAFLQHVATREI